MTVLNDALDVLQKARATSGAVLVGYSGGKDSLVVLDMARREFERVECFFMYLIEGLECVEDQLDLARRRWGVTIRQYPHWVLANALRTGAYCNNHMSLEDLDWKLSDVWALALAEADCKFLLTGAKASDSMWRRRNMTTAVRPDVLTPLKTWNKLDVLGYLRARGIPLPDSSGKNATGVDLSTPSVLWLHDQHPADFRRLCEVFPYVESIVWRRKWYGIS